MGSSGRRRMPLSAAADRQRAREVSPPSPPAFEVIYDEMFPFVWRSAQRLGVAPEALDDVCQEVFMVVYQRYGDYDGRASMKSWIYGMLHNVVRTHRRTQRRKSPAHRSAAPLVDPSSLSSDPAATPHARAQRAEAAQVARAILERLDEDKRIVFCLAELEEMTAPEIAASLEVNVNTIYARLRAARRAFAAAAKRFRAQPQGRSRRD